MLAFLTVATLVPTSHAQEVLTSNQRVLNFPGGAGNDLNTFFDLAKNGFGSYEPSDTIMADINGDGNTDVVVGSLNSAQIFVALGRGNGSFVPVDLNSTANGKAYSIVRAMGIGSTNSGVEALNSSSGRVTSMTTIDKPNTIAVAVDFGLGGQGSVPRSSLDPNLEDIVAYITFGSNGQVTNFTPLPLGFKGLTATVNGSGPANEIDNRLDANPVSIASGVLSRQGGSSDLSILCSGSYDGIVAVGQNQFESVEDGFVAIDRGSNGDIDQRIGGGIVAPVVRENANESGSLYDSRDLSDNTPNVYGTPGLPVIGTGADQPFGNRRRFKVTPAEGIPSVSGTALGIAPRGITLGASAHKEAGAKAILFVATDFGVDPAQEGNEIGGPNGGVKPANNNSSNPNGQGGVFVLINDVSSTGNILRNARDTEHEPYDFSRNPNRFPVTRSGNQDGLFMVSGNIPLGVATGDLNADGSLDVAVANGGAATVSFMLSSQANGIGSIGLPTSGNLDPADTQDTNTIRSYPHALRTSRNVGGVPNSIYTLDYSANGSSGRDNTVDAIVGTNGLSTLPIGGVSTSGFAIFNRASSGVGTGNFVTGSLNFVGSPVGPSRALAPSAPAFDGEPGNMLDFNPPTQEGANSPTPNPNLPDIVVSKIGSPSASSGGVAVRYGQAVSPNSLTYGRIALSNFVGVSEGDLAGNDKFPDTVIADRGLGAIHIVANSSAGFSSASTVKTISLTSFFAGFEVGKGSITSVDCGDVNGDNKMDIVVAVDGDNDQVLVLYNAGNGFIDVVPGGQSIVPFEAGGDPTSIKLVDLTGAPNGTKPRDGRPEIVIAARQTNRVDVLRNNGFGVFENVALTTPSGGTDPMSLTAGDFNDDGRPDIAVLNTGRRNLDSGGGQEDDSRVGILLSQPDGSLVLQNRTIAVQRGGVSVGYAGYGAVKNGIDIDIPDLNRDGAGDIAVACYTSGGEVTDGIINPFTGGQEAASLTLLFGANGQVGEFTPSAPQRLVDVLNTTGGGGRVGIFPGTFDILDGRLIGYGSVIVGADYNQNGFTDIHVGGREANSLLNGVVDDGFAASITFLDNTENGSFISRSFSIFPSALNNSGTVDAKVVIDRDVITGGVAAFGYVESKTGKIIGQDVQDFYVGPANKAPDTFQVTEIGRAYASINITPIRNHAPVGTTKGGTAAFNLPGRKLGIKAGETAKIELTAADVDVNVGDSLVWGGGGSTDTILPGFATLVDNGNGTATITFKPSLTDGSPRSTTGFGKEYQVRVPVFDNSARQGLRSYVFF